MKQSTRSMATGSTHSARRSNRSGKGSIRYPFAFAVPSSLRDPKEERLTIDQLASLRTLEETKNIALHYLHDHEQFAVIWKTKTLHPEIRRWMRKLVQIQTINAIYNGFYRLPDGTKIMLDKGRMHRSAQRTRDYLNDHLYDEARSGKQYEQAARIVVIDGDCLDVALCLKKIYPDCHPVVLNMASAHNPGGAWKNGAGAQEENLHRRTNLLQCLEDPYKELVNEQKWSYPIAEFGGIYSSDVSVFRGSEMAGYPFFPDGPHYLSFISSAAYSNPPTETDSTGQLKLSGKQFIENVKKKIDAMFKIALDNKHDTLILSAFGCGAYRNPPAHIAQLFKEIINYKYAHSFQLLAFAIIDDHNSNKSHNPAGNVQPFAEVFNTNILTVDTLGDGLSPKSF